MWASTLMMTKFCQQQHQTWVVHSSIVDGLEKWKLMTCYFCTLHRETESNPEDDEEGDIFQRWEA